MAVLDVPRSLTSGTNPTEAQFDTMRTYLLGFFNAATMNQDNIAAGGAAWSSLGGATPVPDDEPLKWTSSHATVKYISATDKFELKNTQGSILWAHKEDASTLTEFLELRSTDGALEVWGEMESQTSVGDQTVQLLWLLARYRKPRLVYSDDSIVTVEVNSPDTDESLVLLRDRLVTIVDRTCSLAVDANGETAADVGAAVSGRAAGVARTPNRWYYIYAVLVQYGDDNDGTKAILVATTTAPTSANIATHNTAWGTDKWVYMGVVRNGYNDGTNTDIVVPFTYDESGFLRFTKTVDDNTPGGLVLAEHVAQEVTNLSYDIVIGNAAAATLPDVATRIVVGGWRESHGFEFHYREIASLENHMIVTGGYHVSELSAKSDIVYMEVPLLASYRLVVVMGNVGTNKEITLFGLLDHYV